MQYVTTCSTGSWITYVVTRY